MVPQEKFYAWKLILRPKIPVIYSKKDFGSCYTSTMRGSGSQVEHVLTLASYIWNVSVSMLLQQIFW